MRRPSGAVPQQPLTYLWERHEEMVRQLLAGKRQCDVARDLGISESRLSVIVNSPEFKARLQELSGQKSEEAASLDAYFREAAKKGAAFLGELLDQRTTPFNANLKLKASTAVLDRAGYGPVTKSQGSVDHTVRAEGIFKSLLEATTRRLELGSQRQLEEGEVDT